MTAADVAAMARTGRAKVFAMNADHVEYFTV